MDAFRECLITAQSTLHPFAPGSSLLSKVDLFQRSMFRYARACKDAVRRPSLAVKAHLDGTLDAVILRLRESQLAEHVDHVFSEISPHIHQLDPFADQLVELVMNHQLPVSSQEETTGSLKTGRATVRDTDPIWHMGTERLRFIPFETKTGQAFGLRQDDVIDLLTVLRQSSRSFRNLNLFPTERLIGQLSDFNKQLWIAVNSFKGLKWQHLSKRAVKHAIKKRLCGSTNLVTQGLVVGVTNAANRSLWTAPSIILGSVCLDEGMNRLLHQAA